MLIAVAQTPWQASMKTQDPQLQLREESLAAFL
jgi:hypothetical protein